MGKKLSVFLVVLFSALILALVYFSVLLHPSFRVKTDIKSLLGEQIGIKWVNFLKKEDTGIIFSIVLDGRYYLEPYNINYSPDEYFEVLVSVRGFFFDAKGKLRSVFLPLVIKTKDGSIYNIDRYQKFTSLEEAGGSIQDLLPREDELLRNSALVGNQKNKLVSVTLVTDFEKVRRNISPDAGPEFLALFELQEKYYNHNKDKLVKFINSGEIGERMLFSYVFSGVKVLQ